MGLFSKKDKYKKIDNVPELPPLAQIQNYIRQPVPMPMQGFNMQGFNQARIIGIEESEDGEFIYKIVTNYQLNLGDCKLSN